LSRDKKMGTVKLLDTGEKGNWRREGTGPLILPEHLRRKEKMWWGENGIRLSTGRLDRGNFSLIEGP